MKKFFLRRYPLLPLVVLAITLAARLVSAQNATNTGTWGICTVSYRDLKGVEHLVEVTANSLYMKPSLKAYGHFGKMIGLMR
jgi:hypothetical protein